MTGDDGLAQDFVVHANDRLIRPINERAQRCRSYYRDTNIHAEEQLFWFSETLTGQMLVSPEVFRQRHSAAQSLEQGLRCVASISWQAMQSHPGRAIADSVIALGATLGRFAWVVATHSSDGLEGIASQFAEPYRVAAIQLYDEVQSVHAEMPLCLTETAMNQRLCSAAGAIAAEVPIALVSGASGLHGVFRTVARATRTGVARVSGAWSSLGRGLRGQANGARSMMGGTPPTLAEAVQGLELRGPSALAGTPAPPPIGSGRIVTIRDMTASPALPGNLVFGSMAYGERVQLVTNGERALGFRVRADRGALWSPVIMAGENGSILQETVARVSRRALRVAALGATRRAAGGRGVYDLEMFLVPTSSVEGAAGVVGRWHRVMDFFAYAQEIR